MSIKHIAIILASLVISASVFAYETETHEELTALAYKNSKLGSSLELLEELGVKEDLFEAKSFSNYSQQDDKFDLNSNFIVRSGATFEDVGERGKEDSSRAINHFFDPYNDRGILSLGRPSPDWILEDKVADISKQNYSYRDTKAYLYNALTAESEEERNENVVDRDRLVQAVNTQWQGLNDALTQGDIHQALLFLSPSAIDKYRDVFVALQTEFADIVRSYSPMECNDVALGTVSCTIVREKANGQRALHFIQFGQISNGLWKIMDM